MFQRFHEMRERGAKGFTLIELLVVILIIAILAAIAIPVFLNQREKGWASQVESALKNAATAQESFLTDTANDTYAGTVADLEDEGLRFSTNEVTMGDADVVFDAANGYCMKAVSANNTDIERWYHSDDGQPVSTQPTATGPACP